MAKAKAYKEKERRPTSAPPRSDAYTMMLFVTLVALIAGCVLVYLDWTEYGMQNPDQANFGAPNMQGAALDKLGGGPAAAPAAGGPGGAAGGAAGPGQ